MDANAAYQRPPFAKLSSRPDIAHDSTGLTTKASSFLDIKSECWLNYGSQNKTRDPSYKNMGKSKTSCYPAKFSAGFWNADVKRDVKVESKVIYGIPFDGCSELSTQLKNKILILKRGNCTFAAKARNVIHAAKNNITNRPAAVLVIDQPNIQYTGQWDLKYTIKILIKWYYEWLIIADWRRLHQNVRTWIYVRFPFCLGSLFTIYETTFTEVSKWYRFSLNANYFRLCNLIILVTAIKAFFCLNIVIVISKCCQSML